MKSLRGVAMDRGKKYQETIFKVEAKRMALDGGRDGDRLRPDLGSFVFRYPPELIGGG